MSVEHYYEYKYLIDTTPITRVNKEVFETRFYNKNCFLPEEIVYELRDSPKYNSIKEKTIPITADILQILKDKVMPKLYEQPKLVDLYKYKGNGDVFLIATALARMNEEDGKLLKTKWTIVTEDKGVIDMAKKCNICTIDTKELENICRGES